MVFANHLVLYCLLQSFSSQCPQSKKTKQEQLDGGAVHVEANLQHKLSVHLHFTKLKCCYNCQVLNAISQVVLALTVSKILQFQISTLK